MPRALLAGGCLLTAICGHAAITLDNWSSSPWQLTGGDVDFSATLTDPVYQGGTSASFVFATPKTGVDVSTQSTPDDSVASASVFGVEGTGFGVSETYVGRFNRGESFTLQVDHAFQLNGIRWAEYQGDEAIHIAWTSGGATMSQVFDLPAGSFYTTTNFNDIIIDANTLVTITNVSDTSASASGRLRINQIYTELVDAVTLPEIGETHLLNNWSSAPWSLTSGQTTFSANISDTVLGDVLVSFYDPVTGADISDPQAPDFSSASSSTFGVEGTGFGVGNSGTGRFDRGESFILEADESFELQSIRWVEYSGDESVHFAWQSNGVPMSTVIDLPAGSFYTETELSGIFPDANTPLEITNVSSSGAYLNGRLRINHVELAFLSNAPVTGSTAGAYIFLRDWQQWPWDASPGDSTISGTLWAPENGGSNIAFNFLAYANVDVDTPSAPDFTNATASVFGFESTGFGVGETNVGRFNRGESFTVTAGHDLQIDTIRWREVQGDEQVHISWVNNGTAQSVVLDVTSSTSDLTDVIADANTAIVITNVSPTTSSLNGRLRVQDFKARAVYATAPTYDHSGPDGFVQMMGVNLAGAEFSGFAFWQDNPQEWDYYHSKGLDLIRIPFKWERLQPTLYGAVDFTDLDAIVALADARGMKVVLDMHNYARYNGNVIGTTNVPNAAFADVWRKLADHYKNESAIYGYGIMNEPHGTGGLWPAAAQAAADGIRDVDSNTWIIVAGENYSSASTWRTSNPNLDVQDASGKTMYEAHIYFDQSWPAGDGSYSSFDNENPEDDRGVRLVHPFLLWLQEKNARGFIGEFGVPNNDARWNVLLDEFMAHISAYGMSGTYWAGGENWGNYALDISPTNSYTTDAIPMQVLENYAF
ncbi:glycoside hydrolase family 5 protein [Cerasicoccus fimbriatus]|uniref:glycoside hydrolase family 5 protein n=1 Tax=Cerasicoccus fimbriatus TaxID=3014554 RepID=UPI0022B3DEB6|nr:glycoside hydrolase family 5 protein [Cerasicoccus sp. TK19100]